LPQLELLRFDVVAGLPFQHEAVVALLALKQHSAHLHWTQAVTVRRKGSQMMGETNLDQ
jgi:hypothetical protein